MIKRFTLILIAALSLLYSCKSEKQKMEDRIAAGEQKLFSDSGKAMNTTLAQEQMNMYTSYADSFPTDVKSPEYLYKAADLANGMQHGAYAVELYRKVYEKYPEFKKAPVSLFLQAFIYENQLKNYDKARELYSDFLKKYPNHEFAKDAKFSLENMGKSDEDLLKVLENKNQSPPNQ